MITQHNEHIKKQFDCVQLRLTVGVLGHGPQLIAAHIRMGGAPTGRSLELVLRDWRRFARPKGCGLGRHRGRYFCRNGG